MGRLIAFATTLLLAAGLAQAQEAPSFQTQEGDVTLRDFQFASGEGLPQLRIHYTTLGQPQRDAAGHVINAVLVLHGTRSSGTGFLRPSFGGVLFVPGGILDPKRYFIILPDGIGHGKSSKPSDGQRAKFPSYDYDDMVKAQYRLVTEGLKIDHLRLIIGTSMGCMHSFLWGEQHADFVEAMLPLACLPVPIVGRNRLWRQMLIDAVRADPAWMGGEYKEQPQAGLRTAADLWAMAGSAPLQMQKKMPTPAEVDRYKDAVLQQELAAMDANDLIYQINASRNYDPSAGLERIKAKVTWINSGDDFINPPELGIAEREVGRIAHARFHLLPASDQTQGHGTYFFAAVWKDYLAELLRE